MRYDSLDELLREALQEERAEAQDLLDGVERAVTVRLASEPSTRSRLRSWWQRVRTPRMVMRVAVAGVAAVALLAGFLAGRFWAPGSVLLGEPAGTVFAVVAPKAEVVSVMGDFSAWEPVHLEDPDATGVWTAVLDLPPGRYEYAFLVDGRWVGQDPVADEYVRSFGEYASVRYVRGES